jgi:site-specific recombinase XerD
MFSSRPSEQLWLFDCGGVDVSALRDRRDALRLSVRAGSTVLAYASDWRQFERWCDRAGRCPLPASSDSLELYVTWMFGVGRKVTTVERHVSAVSHIHRVKGLQSPVRPDVREIIRAVRRERKESPVGKAALGVEDLVRLARACDASTALGCVAALLEAGSGGQGAFRRRLGW